MENFDPNVRRVALVGLGLLDSPGYIDRLASFLEDSDAGIRVAAVHKLAECNAPRAVELLVRALRDRSGLVVEAATLALLEFEAIYLLFFGQSLPRFSSRKRSTSRPTSLSSRHTQWGAGSQTLRNALVASSWNIRLAVVEALGATCKLSAINALVDHLRKSDPSTWDENPDTCLAARALERLTRRVSFDAEFLAVIGKACDAYDRKNYRDTAMY